MKLTLIRHGMTEANEKRLYCGSTDLPLSAAGRAALHHLPPPEPGTRLISSGMRRCNETLKALFGDVPYEIEPDLREIDFGDFEGKSYNMLRNDPAYQAWLTGDNEKTSRRTARAASRCSAGRLPRSNASSPRAPTQSL